MQTICAMKWGKRYPGDYANRLLNMIDRHTTRPTQLVCFTDDPSGLDPRILTAPLPPITLPERVQWLGWRKISLFQNGLQHLSGDVLFLDLDIIVTGNLDVFFDYQPDKTFCVIENWTQMGSGIGNTSVYRWRVGAHAYLYDNLMADTEAITNQYPNSQTYVSRNVTEKTFWPGEWCESFKHTLLPKWPMNFFSVAPLPPATRVVAFTGKPDPDEARDGRWAAPWYKKVYKHVRRTPWIAEHWR